MNRAKTKVRRLIDTNINIRKETDKFITLTVKENQQDRDKMNNEFKKFMKRLRYRYQDIEYIAVIEKQERGALHYHVIFLGLPYIKKSELQAIWQHGFVKINKIENYDNLGQYLVKYMTKDIETGRSKRQKRYYISNGLIQPTILENIEMQELYNYEQMQLIFQKQFESEYVGIVDYTYYKNKKR